MEIDEGNDRSLPMIKKSVIASATSLDKSIVKITNPKILKKIAKSEQKKLLKVVLDDLLNKKN